MGNDLFVRVPERYQKSAEAGEILRAVQPEFNRMQDVIDSFTDQLLLSGATWGIDRWEQDYGIDSNIVQTLTERRDHVRSKLRGAGTINSSALEQIAAAFVAGETQVTERPADYAVDMLFHGVIGIPTNLADLQDTLREMLPAHLAIVFLFRYLLVREVRQMTVAALEEQNISSFAF